MNTSTIESFPPMSRCRLEVFRKNTESESKRGHMMKALTLFVLLMLASPALAQTGQPAMRPPLFFSESWQPLPTPPDDHGAWPASQGGVASSNLELTL